VLPRFDFSSFDTASNFSAFMDGAAIVDFNAAPYADAPIFSCWVGYAEN
jgi:hypothetical protein